MESVKLHPFSIASLTSPEKKTVPPNNCDGKSILSDDHPYPSILSRNVPLQRPVPVMSFIPNLLPTDNLKFRSSSSASCAQKLVPMEHLGPTFLPQVNDTAKQCSVGNLNYGSYCDFGYQQYSGLKSPSAKRIKLDQRTDVSPTSTDSGVSRCHSPGGASSTGSASRSSSPIDVLGFDGNDSILAPVAALRRIQGSDTGVAGLRRSLSPGCQSADNGRGSPASMQVPTKDHRQSSQSQTDNSKPSRVTNSRKRLREDDSRPCPVLPKNHVEEPRTEDGKPVHSYIALISMAILNHPERRMVLSDIYQYIMDNFPYYNNDEKAWRNSIRHNLSLNECFVKVGRAENGKGNYWSIHPSCIEDFAKGDYRRRQARRRARTVVTPLELHQAAGTSGLGIPSTMLPPFGPRSAPPTASVVNSRPIKAEPISNSTGYVPMTATTVRDSAFHPYLSAVPNFNFFQAPHGLVPGFPVLPPMHPAHGAVAATVINMRSVPSKAPTAQPKRLSPTKTEDSSCSGSPTPSDGPDVQVSPGLQNIISTSSFTVPRLPGHIPSIW